MEQLIRVKDELHHLSADALQALSARLMMLLFPEKTFVFCWPHNE